MSRAETSFETLRPGGGTIQRRKIISEVTESKINKLRYDEIAKFQRLRDRIVNER